MSVRPRRTPPERLDVQDSPLPDGLVAKYAGKWVAVRDHEVVADADDLETLKRDAAVDDDAMPVFVPEPGNPF